MTTLGGVLGRAPVFRGHALVQRTCVRAWQRNSNRRRSTASAHGYDYDLIVVGGGSGGLACAKEAALLGKRVAVLDYVAPSPQGTVWGLGGTCVNVGCIPKKLMHQASLLGQAVKDARSYGWSVTEPQTHSWEVLSTGVINHIKSLNWGHRVQLKQKNVDYFNAHGSFVDCNTIEVLSKNGNKSKMTSQYFVLAVGGRPHYPENVMGAVTFGITSDDLFFLEKPPGGTLVVGASYVALECAGFLAGLGYPTSLMVRSRCLKAFDQELAALVLRNLEKCGVTVMRSCEPREVGRGEGEKLKVLWTTTEGGSYEDQWDTVLFATGRQAATQALNLQAVGVETEPSSGKLVVDHREETTAGGIFAIGDAINGRWELTPVAVKAGKLLARRLFGASDETMDYDLVPTTVFTPLEFAAVGLSEERAAAHYGAENIEVYHAYYKPLEYYLPERDASECYMKMVCTRSSGAGDREKVLGLHLTGPSAGEVMQGFAVALRLGATRSDLEATVGIHPTCAEEVVKLHITKRSGEDPNVTAC